MSIKPRASNLVTALCEANGGKPGLAVELRLKTTSTLDKWEAGMMVPTRKNIAKLSDASGWPVPKVYAHFLKLKQARDAMRTEKGES